MTQRPRLVSGGELVDGARNALRDVSMLHLSGLLPGDAWARRPWKAEAPRSSDNAHGRGSVARLRRPREQAWAAGEQGR